MQITCPRCTRVIESRDVNIDKLVAVCHRCNEVFSFADSFPTPNIAAVESTTRLVPQPKSIAVENLGYKLHFTRRWFSPAYLGLLLFAIVWDGFLIAWYSAAIFAWVNNGGNNPIDWGMLLFPICHVAVGIGLTYVVAAGLLNKTRIHVGNGMLAVRHGPVPWRGPRELATNEITQLYLSDSGWTSNNNTGYKLYALLKDNRKVTILPAITDPDEGWFIEQQIEAFLGIRDEPVAGEYS